MERFELQTLTDYSDEAILQELRRVAALQGKGPLTMDAYSNLSPKVSSSTLLHRFGGWRKALEVAGLSHLYVQAHMHYSNKVQIGTAMTDDELLCEMQRIHALTGRDALTAKEFNTHSRTHADAVKLRFGSWKVALDKAQIRQAELGKRYTDELCFENIAILWTHYGRQPHHSELKKSPSNVGPKAYILRWGTWRKALAAFIEWGNSESAIEAPKTGSLVVENAEERAGSPRAQRPNEEDCREVRPGLRFKVFMRDRFRCLACGRSPATHLNIELHADHVVSVRDGGKTELENLQTLCRSCNLGKGATSIH